MGEEFKIAVKTWRKKANLVQKQAADVLGVSLRTYQGWEMGSHEPLPMAMMELKRRMDTVKEIGK